MLTIVRNTTYSWLHKNRPATVTQVDDLDAVNRVQTFELETPETALIAQDGETLLEGQLRRCRYRSARRWCYARSRSSVTARLPR